MAKKLFELDRNIPQVMGILNVTPDSFSDGGCFFAGQKVDLDLCCRRVERMMAEGASIIDVGGESTRPGAAPVSPAEEVQRVLPVIEALAQYDVVVSLDSSTPELIDEAARLGIGLINDVRALQRGHALQVAAATQLPVCLMHMQGQPATMQNNPEYHDVLESVMDFFQDRIQACLAAGIARENLLLDPGFGFGKNLEHNKQLLARMSELKSIGLPIVAGFSRKSMISHILGGRDIDQRLPGSIALAVMAVERGAWIVRAHDVKETADAVRIASAIIGAAYG